MNKRYGQPTVPCVDVFVTPSIFAKATYAEP